MRLLRQVSVSMLEIYNETVKDLLNVSSFKKGGLRVREHGQKGFYGGYCPPDARQCVPLSFVVADIDWLLFHLRTFC